MAEMVKKYFGPLCYFSVIFLYSMFWMFILRIVFFVRSYPGVLNDTGLNGLLEAFLVGARFDSSVISYSLMIIASLAIVMFIINLIKDLNVKIYFSLIVFHIVLLFVIILTQMIDVEYFRSFGFHLSFRDLQYLTSSEVYGTIASDYPILFYMIFIVSVLTIFFFLNKKLIFLIVPGRTGKSSALYIFNIIISAGLLIIAARGGISTSNLNWGSSFFSDNDKLNQSSLNGIFTIGKSYDLDRKSKASKKAGMIKNIITDDKIIADLILKGEKYDKIESPNVLKRKTYTGYPRRDLNVVLVLLEGWTFENINSSVNGIEITPYFNELIKKGIYFSKCYSTGTRSNKGIESVICSVPGQYGISALKRIEGQKPFYSIPIVLKDRGYNNLFIYGGDPEFDNMKGFLRVNGINNCIGLDEIGSDDKASKWGSFDEDTFTKALTETDKLSKPFFTFIFTLSSHEPFELPDSFVSKLDNNENKNKYLNSLIYSDSALRGFMAEFSQKPYFDETVFVFISDHGRNRHKNIPIDREKFHIPFLIYSENPAVKEKTGEITKTCSQSDVLPILMGILGGEYENASWGKDILSRYDDSFAFMTDGDRIGLLQNDTLTVQAAGAEAKFYDENDSLIRFEQNSKEFSKRKELLGNILYYSAEYLNRQIHGR